MYDHSLLVSTVTALSGRALESDDIDAFLTDAMDRLVAVCGAAGCRMTLAATDDLALDAAAGTAGEPGGPGHLLVPFELDGRTGTLDVWSRDGRAWADEDREAVEALGVLVAAYAVGAVRLRQQLRLAEQLQTALESRTVIEQAKGVVAARNGVTVDAAFELIRRHARTHHVTVRAVAGAVVDLGLQV